MLRLLRHLVALSSSLAALATAQGSLVAIPEEAPSPALRDAVKIHLELQCEPLHLHLGREAPEGAVLLHLDRDDWLSDRELTARMSDAEAIVFSGGTFLEWYDKLLKDERRTQFTGGIFDALRTGTHVIGRGGAAAFFSRGTCIPRERLVAREDSRPRNPRVRSEHSPVVGLGLGPPGYLDCAAFGGAPERLMFALDDTHVDLGWWLAPDTALVYDYASSKVRVLGPGHVVLFDLRRAKRDKRATVGARLSVLRSGEGWFRERRRLVLDAPSRPVGTRTDGSPATDAQRAAADAWTAQLFPASPRPYHAELATDADSAWVGPDDAPRPLALRLAWTRPERVEADDEDSSRFEAGERSGSR